MTHVLRYDAAPAKRILKLNETPEIRAQRRRVVELLQPLPGERILDIGCGTGHLAAEIAEALGRREDVFGVDASEHMLSLARGRLLHAQRGDATSLPFANCSFDAVLATQVYEFVEDLGIALAELGRVLRENGRAVILDTDWDSLVWHSSDERRMRRVLDGWRRRVAHPRLPRTLAARLASAGLELASCEVLVLLDLRGEDGSYSLHQISHLGASAIGVQPGDVAAWGADLRELAHGGSYFFSLNRYIFIARKPARG